MPEQVITPDYDSIIKAQEEKIAELMLQVDSVTTAASGKTTKERSEKAETTSESMELSEAETRLLIDDQLRKYGWQAEPIISVTLMAPPAEGQNLAIAVWPTDSFVGKSGYADYALFVGLQVGWIHRRQRRLCRHLHRLLITNAKNYARNTNRSIIPIPSGNGTNMPFPSFSLPTAGSILKQIEQSPAFGSWIFVKGSNAPGKLSKFGISPGYHGDAGKGYCGGKCSPAKHPL
jgi:type I restriction enzyme R subunit